MTSRDTGRHTDTSPPSTTGTPPPSTHDDKSCSPPLLNANMLTLSQSSTEYIAVAIDKNGTVYGTTTDGNRVPLTKTPYSTPESATLTQVDEMWVGSRYRFYADEDTTFTDEETGEQVSINSDDIEDNLPVGATLTMRDRYASVTVRRIDERSYNINGYETDHCGAPYDAGDALDFIFKWYGTCTRHTITRP